MATNAASSRYGTILRLASGGMATVWVGQVRGALGFRQLVAIKKPHPHLLDDPSFRAELVAEARLASMIHHANVVDVRDVEVDGQSISLVMDYIEGASLGDLLVAASRKGQRLPPRVAVRITLDACAGLQAAHDLVDERGRPVGLVHRDISPQNILVGTDGIARVADFGVAKFARKNMQSTSEGSLKGKLAYMAPEYLRGESIDRRFDVFAMGVVLWEALTGKRCLRGENEADTLQRVLHHDPGPPSQIVPELGTALDAVLAGALAKERDSRFQNAAAMAAALEASALGAGLLGGHSEVASTLKELVGAAIEERRTLVRAKLANEPSVASLMGVPPIVPDRASGPDAAAAAAETRPEGPADATSRDVPPTMAAATPKMGGGAAAPATFGIPSTTAPMAPAAVPSTAPGPYAPSTLASPGAMPAASAASGVPSTQPMTSEPPPREGAMRTLASPGAGAQGRASPAGGTLLSEPLAPPPDAHLSFHEPSAHGYTASGVTDASALPRPRRWVVPALVALATAALAGGAFVLSTRGGTAVPASASAPSVETSATATAPAGTSAGSAPPSAAPTAAPAPPEPELPAAEPVPQPRGAAPGTRPAGRPPKSAAPASSPALTVAPEPSPAPTATGRKPPRNPYE